MAEIEGSFAQKLDVLFNQYRKPDGSQYSPEEVEKATKGAVTRVYIWKLRKGLATNPGYHVIKALADFFHVDPGYFFTKEQDAEVVPNNETVKRITRRAYDLDEDLREQLLNMMDLMYEGQKKRKRRK